MNIYTKMNIKKDECYTSYCEAEKLVNYLTVNKVIKKDSKIWLPFDNCLSNIYKAFINYGYTNLILSNLELGLDFYYYMPKDFDFIISNPPFSGRTNLLNRLLDIDKPFIILQGTQFFNNQYAVKYLCNLQQYFQFIMPRSRMNFLMYDTNENIIRSGKSSAAFYSFWLCYKINLSEVFNFLPDSGKEKTIERFDIEGNIIKDNHYSLLSFIDNNKGD